MDINLIIAVSAGFVGGGGLAYVVWDKALKAKKKKIISEGETEAEVIKKDKILQAKEKFLQLKAEHEKYINEKNNTLANLENHPRKPERSVATGGTQD